MPVNIQCAYALTLSAVPFLPMIARKKLALDDIEHDDEIMMRRNDYVSWEVSIGDNKYEFYHGFPGDNPVGILMQGEKLIAEVGGGRVKIIAKSEDAILFAEWYNEVTKEPGYKLEEFRASKLAARRV